jgi:hypothetical protein
MEGNPVPGPVPFFENPVLILVPVKKISPDSNNRWLISCWLLVVVLFFPSKKTLVLVVVPILDIK